MKKTFVLVSVVVVFASLGVGCGKKQEAKTTTGVAMIPNVTIIKAHRSSLADAYEATGTVNAKSTTHVSANLLGRINSITVSEGDSVRKGQTLVEMDNREARSQVEKAQAALSEAQASLIELDNSTVAASAVVRTAEANKQFVDVTFARYKELYSRRSASGQEYDDAHSRSGAARSELERAKAEVQRIISKRGQVNARIEQAKAEIANANVYASYSRIVSPVTGVIVKQFAEPGAMATPGVPLLSIEDNSKYRLEVAVAESNSKLVHIGSRVDVRIDAIGTNEISGTVVEVLPTSDAASRTYTVKIDLPANQSLRTGQYGVARFIYSQKEAITVPQAAIIQRGQLAGVYTVASDGTIRFRIVTTGMISEGTVEVLSGVSEGDEIVSSDASKLNDGVKVR